MPEFGALTPLLAPRSVAVIGASDREGNLGGLCVSYLGRFGFTGPVWPVNTGRSTVAGLPCFPTLASLPAVPDLAVIAVPADAAVAVVRECIATHVPAAIVWAGGFAEADDAGRARQLALEAACRGSEIKLCGPNCIGIINTSIGLTASFSSLMTEIERFNEGSVSIVSQSGGIAVTSHGRAQELGLGFRLTISCGNEATLGIPDFVDALVEDRGTRVIAVYTEGLGNPRAFAAALGRARACGKPVVVLKGGASAVAGKAALAHTGKLAGLDRTYDAIFREFAAIRVFSTEELLDVCLHLAALTPQQRPRGNRVLLSTFGGGSGVIGTDQCVREGLAVPPLDTELRQRLAPILTPLASSMNPVDLTPGSVTDPGNRASLPEVLRLIGEAPNVDSVVFMSAGFGKQAPAVVDMVETLRVRLEKPMAVSWLSPPPGIVEAFAARGVRVFDEHARAIRVTAHAARWAEDMRGRIVHRPELVLGFDWKRFVPTSVGSRIVSEDVVAAILTAADLPVAHGEIARDAAACVRAAEAIGYPVVIKAISPDITHRAAAGLVALHVDSPEAAARIAQRFQARAVELSARLDGIWVQRMERGTVELLVTAFRDAEFGVMVGCGMGGGMTEIIDDIVFARAPIDDAGAFDLIGRLRTLRRLPALLPDAQRAAVAAFAARFSSLAGSAPWPRFTLEVNPILLGDGVCAAVDGLLVIE